jgi:tRNA (guanine10-N2)-methyltransferase
MYIDQVGGHSKRTQSNKLIFRSIVLARSVYELYARGRTYEELHERNRTASRYLWEKYIPDTSFKFVVNGYNHSISKARQRQVIEDFSYMGFMGKIDLQNPEFTFGCFEECEFLSFRGLTAWCSRTYDSYYYLPNRL